MYNSLCYLLFLIICETYQSENCFRINTTPIFSVYKCHYLTSCQTKHHSFLRRTFIKQNIAAGQKSLQKLLRKVKSVLTKAYVAIECRCHLNLNFIEKRRDEIMIRGFGFDCICILAHSSQRACKSVNNIICCVIFPQISFCVSVNKGVYMHTLVCVCV